MSAVAIALIVAVIAPSVLAFLTNRLARSDKREDYARLDLVAARAEEAARLVGVRQDVAAAQASEAARLLVQRQDAIADQAAEAARLLVEANAAVAKTAAVTAEVVTTKLDVIHGLVNSSLTTAMQSEFDATIRELALMREVAALHQAAGREPTSETLGAIEATETKIGELSNLLADRRTQAVATEPQVELATEAEEALRDDAARD